MNYGFPNQGLCIAFVERALHHVATALSILPVTAGNAQ